MMSCRAFALAAVLVVVPLQAADAQFGGMPGLPGAAGPSFAPPQPPPVCLQILALRDEAQKHATAIQAANQHKATPEEACRLFRAFLSADAKMIKGAEDNAVVCGVPPEIRKQMKEGHARAEQVGKQVCDAAALGPRPAGPSLSDALGASPTVPDATTNRRTGSSTFDTLTGNALQR